MRKIVFASLVLLLAACQPGVGEVNKTVALVKQHCGLVVNAADVAAALSAPNAAVTGAIAVAREICKQAQAQGETGALDHFMFRLVHHEWAQAEPPKDDCVAIVNGVCIRKETK